MALPGARGRQERLQREAARHHARGRQEDGPRLAKEKKLRVGCAPDTFLGGGIQTCRKLIDDGWIGQPVAATAFMICHGHESWHPIPEFYYKAGGGPMFDMGPYYLTALVNLLGPVKRVTGSAAHHLPRAHHHQPAQVRHRRSRSRCPPTSPACWISPTAPSARSSPASTSGPHNLPLHRDLRHRRASLSVPDPNGFGGPVQVRRAGAKEWTEVPAHPRLRREQPRHRRGGHGLCASAPAARTAPAASWPTTCWTSCTPSTTPRAGQARSQLESTCQQPAPMVMNLCRGRWRSSAASKHKDAKKALRHEGQFSLCLCAFFVPLCLVRQTPYKSTHTAPAW